MAATAGLLDAAQALANICERHVATLANTTQQDRAEAWAEAQAAKVVEYNLRAEAAAVRSSSFSCRFRKRVFFKILTSSGVASESRISPSARIVCLSHLY